jgi:hypothetical protein
VDRGHIDVHDLVRIRIIEAVVTCQPTCGVLGGNPVDQDVASPGKCRRVRGVLLIAPLDEHHPDIERKGADEEQDEESAGKEDEDLPAFTVTASC